MAADIATNGWAPHSQWELGPQEGGRPTLLVTTVELGPDHSGTITLYEGDDPREVAEEFCAAHGLPLAVAEPLTLHILDNLDCLEAYDAENTPELSQAEDIEAVGLPPRPASTTAGSEAPASARRGGGGSAPLPPPLARPSSSTSALATQYYGRPVHSAAPGHRSPEAAAAPAADRLYADHFRKQAMLEEQRRIRNLETQLASQQVYCTPVSRALAAHRTAGGYGSYGERLYAEGRLEALRREAEAAQARAAEAQAELQAATFRPDISRTARELKARAGRPGSGGAAAPWDRLHSQGSAMKRERRAEAIRREQQEEELKECSFRPRVNTKSQAMVAARRGAAVGLRAAMGPQPDGSESSDGEFMAAGGKGAPARALPLHERLYNEGRHAAARAAETAAAWLPEGATFRPRVNRSSAALADLVAAAQGDADGALGRDVAERLLRRGRRYRERLEAARAAAEAAVDDAGRPLFRPHTLPPPPGVKSAARAGPIGDHLYGAALGAAAKADAQAAAARAAATRAAAARHVNATSDRLMARLRRQRVAAIFAFLAQAPSAGDHPLGDVSIVEGAENDAPGSVSGGEAAAQPGQRRMNLLGVLRDEAFMDGIDPEVRADVEHAGRILARTLQRAAGDDPDTAADDDPAAAEGEEWTLGADPPLSARSAATAAASPEAEAAWIACGGAPGEVTEGAFQALMAEVLSRTRGIARAYLQPLPSARKKWDDPSFRPAVDPTSLALAERLRPEGLPAHELLYRVAQEAAGRREVAKAEAEASALRECSFRPALVAAPKAAKGRALAAAAAPPPPRRDPAADAAAAQARAAAAADAEMVAAQAALAEERARRRREALTAGGAASRPRTAASLAPEATPVPGPDPSYSALHLGGSSARGGSVAGASAAGPPPEPEASPCPAAALLFGADGESLEQGIDAIERQIQEAMARLSMTGESFAARLAGRGVPAAAAAAAAAQPPQRLESVEEVPEEGAQGCGQRGPAETPLANAPELAARLRASIDYHALFGAASPPQGAGEADNSAIDVADASDFNPVGDGDGATPALTAAAAEGQPERAVNLLAQLAAMPLEFAECTGSSC